MKVEVRNTIGAKTGDRIVLNFATSSLMKAAFLLYVFPILCMIAGGFVGEKFAISFGINKSALSAVFAFISFFFAFFFVKLKGNKLSKKNEYKPEITRIIKRIGKK